MHRVLRVRSVLAVLLLSVCIALSGYIIYTGQKQQVTSEVKDQLTAVAELKVWQIEAWRRERIGDAEIASRSELVVNQLRRFLGQPGRTDLKADIIGWMRRHQEASGYRSVLLVDLGGKVVIATGDHSTKVGPHAIKLIQEAVRKRGPILSDFHTVEAAPYPHLDLAAPLFDARGKALAVLLFRIDPSTFLYPLIQSWPTKSRSGETLLVRLEADRVLFLNELRHRTDAPLQLSLPVGSRSRTASTSAVQIGPGMFEGLDYRGVKVLSASSIVSGTPWFLVAKIDQDEIYGPLQQHAWYIGISTLLLMLAVGLAVLFWFRKKSAEDLRQQMAADYERQSLRERYDYLSKYANDIILLLDSTGRIIEANDRAVTSFGFTRAELLGRSLRDLQSPETMDQMETQMQLVHERNGLVFESEHRRKDTTTFPSETSSREIEAGGRTVYQCIIRDITERRQAEQQVRESQKLLQTIIETEPECIKLLDREGRLLMMNRAGLDMIQAESFEQVKGQFMGTLVKPEHRDAFSNVAQEVFRGRSARLEFEVVGLNGRELWLETHAVPLRNGRNEITSLLGVTRNITEQKKAERDIRTITRLYAVLSQIDQAIVRSQERQELFESICRIIVWYGQFKMALIGLVDEQTPVWRPVASSGAHEDDLKTLTIPMDKREATGPTARALKTGKYVACNDMQNDPDLAPFHELIAERGYRSSAAYPLILKGGTIGSLTIYSSERDFFNHDELELFDEIARDISFAVENIEREALRKQAEAALVREKNRSAAIIAAIGDGISIQDRNFRIIYQNEHHVAMAGHHVGEECYRAYENRDARCEDCPVALSFEDGLVHRAERALPGNGHPRCFDIASSPLRDDEGRIIAGIEAVREITDRKQAELRVAESEKRYRLLVESITDYIYTVKVEQGRPVRTTHGPGCLAVTGFSSEEFDRDKDLWYRIIHGDDRVAVVEHAASILTGQPVSPFEHRIIHKNGSLRWIRNTPVPRFNEAGELVDYDGLISNITPLKQLEAQLRQAQKMEAVGQLAGGIAHDFNNILTAIIGYGNLLRMKLAPETGLRTYVEQILASSERAASLTHSLLAFSRKQVIDLKPLDINAVISRVERLLQRLIGEDIEFRTSLSPGTLPVLSDSVQIEQVLMNLVTNARDAMPNGGTLLIETSVFEMGDEFQRTHAYGKPGSYALMSVTDTGIGMDERTRVKIFDPFFTTKEVGKGTGLGLAMVYGIVKQHNGYINVYSEPDKGTSFKIYLPLTARLDRLQQPEVPLPSHQGSETVLLAEDDDEVRKLTRTVLQDFGYRVLEAEDGEAAVALFTADPNAVDLLVFDMIMPKKNGKEAYLEIKKLRPDIKALFMSGYTADMAHKQGILETGLDFVLKPISPTDFLKKVREVLDRK